MAAAANGYASSATQNRPICAAVSVDQPGIALLIFGLIEAELRARLGSNVPLPGILPEGRVGEPTACALLAASDGLHLTYTRAESSSTGSPRSSAPSSHCSTSRRPGPRNRPEQGKA